MRFFAIYCDFFGGGWLCCEVAIFHWKAFAELVNSSVVYPISHGVDLEGGPSASVLFREQIWPNNLTDEQIDEITADLDDRYNKGTQVYKEEHPEFDPANVIFPDFDASVR